MKNAIANLLKFSVLLFMLFAVGCGMGNAEMIKFNADGQKVEQVRTGWFYCLYWFGLERPYLDYNNQFTVSADRFEGQNDPNAVEVAIKALTIIEGL
jgi:hypothetical protein